MPWRRRPRAALVIGLLGATALLAAAAGLRAPDPVSPTASIDNTLTRDPSGCAGVRSTVWHPLSGVEYTGRLRISLPAQFGGAIVLFVGDSIPLDIEAETDEGAPVLMSRERLTAGPGVHVPPDFWLDDHTPWDAPREITQVTIDAAGDRDRVFTLSLGRRAPRVLARLIGYPADVRLPVCAALVRAGETYFATGWYGQEHDVVEGPVRWMREHGAVLVPSSHGRMTRIRARLAPAVTAGVGDQATLGVRVNDVLDVKVGTLRAGFADYEFMVPDAAWVPGTNELLFQVSRTQERGTRRLGLALASLHVE
jgi:hypothetical protein